MRTRLLLPLVLLVSTLGLADEVAQSRALYKTAIDAYKQKDFATFLTNIKEASDLRPQQTELLYTLACGYALNGRADDALATLDRVADIGMSYDVAKDDDLTSLRGDTRFTALVARLAKNGESFGSIETAFTIPEKGLIAEGMAWDSKTKQFFVSSARQRKIYAIRDRRARVFASELPCGIFGMAIDAQRRILWAACSGVEETGGLSPEMKDRARVLAVDLATGRVKQTIAPRDDAPHLFGDLALAPNGDVYVTDSRVPNIYLVRNGRLETVVRNGPFASLQGVAVAGKSMLLVADYSRGIVAVDIRTGDSRVLTTPPDITLLGIDGIYLHGGSLIAVQNGTNPKRILRIGVSRDLTRVEKVEVLAAAHASMNDPTLGVLAGDAFYFNGNSGWELFGTGKPVDPEKLEEANVLRIRLR